MSTEFRPDDEVTFFLGTSARTRLALGEDFYKRVMAARFKGHSIRRIARELGCDKNTVNSAVRLWLTQLYLPSPSSSSSAPGEETHGSSCKKRPSPKIN